ncbi:MAG TPA: hypothetical protein VFT34_12430 [Verrucomicrobiae bacterium]|nr:hypothetical protein [Verrucomicrobiae bacterium]
MKTLLLLASAAMAFAATAAENSPTAIEPQSLHRTTDPAATRVLPEPPPFKSVEAMQAEFVRRFEASPGFGLSRVIRPIFLAPTPSLVWNGAAYRVVPPELVALEDEPIVYAPREHAAFRTGISTNVTRREVRKLFKHRPLSSLETNAVLALREGRDLVVLTNRVAVPEAEVELISTPDLLVFGALRAGKTCAACHQCDEGTLLGAFAYRLAPAAMPPDKAPNSTVLRSNLIARLFASL